jgi:hypothetical protein
VVQILQGKKSKGGRESAPTIRMFLPRRFEGLALGRLTTVTDGLAAVDDADGLVRDELHRTEWVGLQLHGGLFEAGARLTRWARPLVRRPCCRAVRRLGNDGGGDWLGRCGHC